MLLRGVILFGALVIATCVAPVLRVFALAAIMAAAFVAWCLKNRPFELLELRIDLNPSQAEVDAVIALYDSNFTKPSRVVATLTALRQSALRAGKRLWELSVAGVKFLFF